MARLGQGREMQMRSSGDILQLSGDSWSGDGRLGLQPASLPTTRLTVLSSHRENNADKNP